MPNAPVLIVVKALVALDWLPPEKVIFDVERLVSADDVTALSRPIVVDNDVTVDKSSILS